MKKALNMASNQDSHTPLFRWGQIKELCFQVQAEHGLLRIQGEAASSWTEERQRGGAEAFDKEEERSAAWPTSLDMTLPLDQSSKPEGLPDNVLFQSIRNSYEVIMLE